MNGSGNILHLCHNTGTDYLSRIQSALGRACTAAGLRCTMENTFVTGRSSEDVLTDTAPVGVVLTPPLSDDRHLLAVLEARRIPYVRISPLLDLERGGRVMMDEYDAARAVTQLLLDKGHRRIGIMRGPNSHLVSMRRFNGYVNALGGKGLRVDQELVAQGDFSRESGRIEAGKLFAARPTAIFACNDDMAAGIIDAARAAGIDVPREISIVGYDDNAVARTLRPRLTTVRQPLEKFGEAAGEILASLIRRQGSANKSRTIPYELVERDSIVEPTPAGLPA